MQRKFFVLIVFLSVLMFRQSFADETKLSPQELVDKANLEFLNQNWDVAASDYESALKISPETFASHYQFGVSLYNMNEYKKSIFHLKSFLETPNSDPAHVYSSNKIIDDLSKMEPIAWSYETITEWRPLGRKAYIKFDEETVQEARDRYESIVNDLAYVVFSPTKYLCSEDGPTDCLNTPVFKGKRGRSDTMKLVMSIALFESGYRRDVDFNLGKLSRGDNGRSWCLMQINIGEGLTKEGWTGKDLIEDRKKCFAAGLNLIRQSFKSCKDTDYELLDRLTGYTVGRCIKNEPKSRQRVTLSIKLMKKHRPDPDSVIQELLFPTLNSNGQIRVVLKDTL
jgi:tetratricopeptide (TPR) repeat protein